MDRGSAQLNVHLPVDPVELLAQLVEIDSTNPDLGAGVGEGEIARFVQSWLTERGVPAILQDTGRPNRPNVVAQFSGGPGPKLMLNAHLDTVGVGGMTDPFAPRIEEGQMWGRGTIDMKAGLAAFMVATVQAAARAVQGSVLFTGVVDEEHASIGTEAIVAEYTADAALLSEPSGLEVVVAHKGFVWFEIETTGIAAHGSRPDLGVDAIAKMGPVLVGLKALSHELADRPAHPLLGNGSLHASLITGGRELSTYPAQCVLGIERRTLPGETAEGVTAEIATMLSRVARAEHEAPPILQTTFSRSPYELDATHPFAALVGRHTAAVTGRPARPVGHSGWMDSAILADAGIPTVIVGPKGEGLHADEEWVDLGSVHNLIDITSRIIDDFCGTG